MHATLTTLPYQSLVRDALVAVDPLDLGFESDYEWAVIEIAAHVARHGSYALLSAVIGLFPDIPESKAQAVAARVIRNLATA